MKLVIDIPKKDYDAIMQEFDLGNEWSLDYWGRKVAKGKVFSKENYIPVEWLKEKLTNHPEIPYAVTDGISNVLDLWERNKE